MNLDLFESFSELNLLLRMNYTTQQPRVMVDVGGHRGGFSKAFAKRGWRVIAFEPEPTNNHLFQLNLQKYSNTTCISKAVADVSGQEVKFYVSSRHAGVHSLKPFHSTHTHEITVETIRLDDALDDLKIKHVTLLKVDTEGADFLALRGFNFQQMQPELVMAEFMDNRSMQNFGYTHHDMASFMNQWGYVTYVSEWAAIQQYGHSHQFLQCVPYPLNHVPAWGNLIFIPERKVEIFEQTLSHYIRDLQRFKYFKAVDGARTLLRLPGAMRLAYAFRRLSGYRV